MAKDFVVQFGYGNPTLMTGLSPTFTVFKVVGQGNTTPPAITEIPTSTGLYTFSYTPLSAIAFVIDGGSALSASSRYVVSSLDPVQTVDQGVSGIIASLGSTASSFGSTSVDPGTVYGYLKRLQEFNEGNSSFTKSSGVWDVYSRGSSTLLAEKTITQSTTSVTKT
jgi:hypothetical protein